MPRSPAAPAPTTRAGISAPAPVRSGGATGSWVTAALTATWAGRCIVTTDGPRDCVSVGSSIGRLISCDGRGTRVSGGGPVPTPWLDPRVVAAARGPAWGAAGPGPGRGPQ